MIIPCSGQRGCGTREEGGLYMCVGVSPTGTPIEEFILDPAREFRGKHFLSPILYERNGIYDILIWVGAEFYPFVPDFIEEAQWMGISRKIRTNFPIDKLTPGESRMILIHKRAIPKFEYEVLPTGWCLKSDEDHLCTFDLWPLSSLRSMKNHKVLQEDDIQMQVEIVTPSVSYHVTKPLFAESWGYQAGAFAAFYITHLEYINLENKAPGELAKKVDTAGYEMLVLSD